MSKKAAPAPSPVRIESPGVSIIIKSGREKTKRGTPKPVPGAESERP